MSVAAFMGSAVGALWRERRYDAAKMEAVQRARLARLLAHARGRTRLGAERLAQVDPTHADLARVPPIGKEALMARFDDSIVDGALRLEDVRRFTGDKGQVGRRLDDRFVCATTSGTTGRVGYFVTDARASVTK